MHNNTAPKPLITQVYSLPSRSSYDLLLTGKMNSKSSSSPQGTIQSNISASIGSHLIDEQWRETLTSSPCAFTHLKVKNYESKAQTIEHEQDQGKPLLLYDLIWVIFDPRNEIWNQWGFRQLSILVIDLMWSIWHCNFHFTNF